MRSVRFVQVCLGTSLLLGLAGCTGGQPKLCPVSGTVNFKGKPLDRGAITFLSDDPTMGAGGGAMIEEGHYDIPAKQGLPPGRYKVIITSVDPKNQTPDPDALPGYLPVPKDRIKPKYNSQTTLKAEITTEGPNKFDFEVD